MHRSATLLTLFSLGCASAPQPSTASNAVGPPTTVVEPTTGAETAPDTASADVLEIAPAALLAGPDGELIRLLPDGTVRGRGRDVARLLPDGRLTASGESTVVIDASGRLFMEGEAVARIDGNRLLFAGETSTYFEHTPGLVTTYDGGEAGERLDVEGNAPSRTVLVLTFLLTLMMSAAGP